MKRRNVKTHMKIMVSLLSVTMLISMFGCQKTPESEYVTNKEGQGSLISNHAVEDSGISIRQQLGIPESVQEDLKTLNDYTDLWIDAGTVTPDQSAIPIYTLRPMEITEERVKDIAGVFFDGGDIHSKEFGTTTRTKDDIYLEINYIQEGITRLETAIENGDTEELDFYENPERTLQDDKLRLASLMAELQNAPDEVLYEGEADYSFSSYASPLKVEQDNDIVNAGYSYDVCDLVGIHEGSQFEMTVEKEENASILSFYLLKEDERINSQNITRWDSGSYIVSGQNECKYSYEEAVVMANEWLEKLNFYDMKVQYGKNLDYYINASSPAGSSGYVLFCYRTYENMSDEYFKEYGRYKSVWDDDFSSRRMLYYTMGYNPDKQIIENTGTNREYAIVTVKDDGITEMQIINPMEEVELQAENVNLLNFDQVLQQGVNQLEVLYADAGTGYEFFERIKIQSIELNYGYMQSPDNPNEYTMIPVWDFKTHPKGSTVVSINAIDGTAFDRVGGY